MNTEQQFEEAQTPESVVVVEPEAIEIQEIQEAQKPGEKPREPSVVPPTAPKASFNVVGVVNSPWLLITLPLLIGGIWLVNNTWVITNNLDKPYMLLAGPTAVASIVGGWFIIKFFSAISVWCKAAWSALQRGRKEDGSAQFFWFVIIVFMIVSVFASGSFFSKIEHDVFPGLGYVTAFLFDLVAVQSMRARLNAVRMRDKKGARIYLLGVLACSGASAFANVYTSLGDFQNKGTSGIPLWMVHAAPWFGLVFPVLILLLSITADYTLDQISTKLDPEQYKTQESKRTKLLEYQRDALQARQSLEIEIDRIAVKAGKVKRTFFLINWFFPKDPLNMDVVVENVVSQANGQIEEIVKNTYGSSLQMVLAQNRDLHQQILTLSQKITSIEAQKDEDLFLVSREIEEAKSQAIDASISRLQQEKEDIISLTIQEVLGQLETGHDTDELSVPQTENQTTFRGEDQVQDPPMNKSKRTTISRDLSPNSTPDADDLDEETKTVLRNYPFLAAAHSTGVRSMTISEIVKATGHTPQLVNARKRDGIFYATRRKGFYSIASIINWLKTEKIPTPKETDVLAESTLEIRHEQAQNTPVVSATRSPRITGKLWSKDGDEILEDLGEMVIA